MEEDLKCAPRLPGCGTQHPHRALGGTRVLLAAAPTTPPCFRHWRRSSLLQRKNYFKFWGTETPAGVSVPFFHGWGLGTNSLSQSLTALPAPSKREPLARPQALHFSRKPYRYAKGPISEGAGIERSEMTGGVPSGAPERADFPSFRPKFHVLGRKSQTIKQNAQKGGAKFGGGGLDRFREKIFEKQNDELKRVIATK